MYRRERLTLRRDIGWFGSFSMGYADVGADIFIALGFVTAFAAGATPLAFLVAALVYLCVGMTYAELASTYPYAGGAQVYTLRAFNDLTSFLTGWALIIAYTVDIALFSIAAVGYFTFLVPYVGQLSLTLPLANIRLTSLGVIAAVLVGVLVALNYIGIRYSAWLVSLLTSLGLTVLGITLVLGYAFVFNPSLFLSQVSSFGSPNVLKEVGYVSNSWINVQNFLYGTTLAMASFIGIESIAQAAEETKNPPKLIPRAAKLSIVAVTVSVVGFSTLSMGIVKWDELGSAINNPLSFLASRYPIWGSFLSIVMALAGMIICTASANTGIVGASRLSASMGKFKLVPRWFYNIHPRFRVPSRTIVTFGLVGAVLALTGNLIFVAEVYTFAALLSYLMLMLAMIRIRNIEGEAYRPWKLPWSLKLKIAEKKVEIPLFGIAGLIGTGVLWSLVLVLHPSGRVLGGVWMVFGLVVYLIYRVKKRMPLIYSGISSSIKPGIYLMNIWVLIRPLEEAPLTDKIVKSVANSLDRRFRVKLVSIIDPKSLTPRWALRMGVSILKDLDKSASMLRKMGYETFTEVYFGSMEDIVRIGMERENVDLLGMIRLMPQKVELEKPLDPLYKVASQHNGKVLVLKGE